jgi:hypothetical protein
MGTRERKVIFISDNNRSNQISIPDYAPVFKQGLQDYNSGPRTDLGDMEIRQHDNITIGILRHTKWHASVA